MPAVRAWGRESIKPQSTVIPLIIDYLAVIG